jgi:hypothetical protein
LRRLLGILGRNDASINADPVWDPETEEYSWLKRPIDRAELTRWVIRKISGEQIGQIPFFPAKLNQHLERSQEDCEIVRARDFAGITRAQEFAKRLRELVKHASLPASQLDQALQKAEAQGIDKKQFKTKLRRRSTNKSLGINWTQFDKPIDIMDGLQSCAILKDLGFTIPEEAREQIEKWMQAESDPRKLAADLHLMR